MSTETIRTIDLDGLEVAYRDAGSGPPVLLIHGWPTSSFLWRNVMPAIAERNRVVAIDLPGFGDSSKPPDARYDLPLFARAIDGLLAELEIDRVGVAVHDLGGPIGVHWALHNRVRISRLAILNTLLYPEFSPAVAEFVTACATPELREQLTSPDGLTDVLRLGLADESHLTEEVRAGVLRPFRSADDRLALANAGIGIDPAAFTEIASGLPELDVPVRVVYGAGDRILPDVAETMARVSRDLPDAEVTALEGLGHFLQEEAPEQVGVLLAEFFAAEPAQPVSRS